MFVRITTRVPRKYATDRSPYHITPRAVAIPRTEKEVQEAVRRAIAQNWTMTPRGAGTGLSGAAVGNGMIIDCSSLKKISAIRNGRVTVGPGAVFAAVDAKARRKGLFLPYAPSSGKECSLGGNLNTKAAGLRSVKYGSIDALVESVRFVDAAGSVIDTAQQLPKEWEHKIRALQKKFKKNARAQRVLKKRMNLKSSSGYNVAALVHSQRPQDIVTHLLVGSAGTLGIVTEIRLRLVPLPRKTITCLAFFPSLNAAGAAVMRIRPHTPSALEILDSASLAILAQHTPHRIPKSAHAALLIEFDDHIKEARKRLPRWLGVSDSQIEDDPRAQRRLWKVRTDMLNLIEQQSHALALVEDVGVPPGHLAPFIADLQKIFKKNHTPSVIYGHAGEGNLHVRPAISKAQGRPTIRRVAHACYRAALRHGGTVTGEHGMGRNKSPYLRSEWGPVYPFFADIKNIFDPHHRLNPDVLTPPADITCNMRFA